MTGNGVIGGIFLRVLYKCFIIREDASLLIRKLESETPVQSHQNPPETVILFNK